MKISVFGAGYVGLVSAVGLAEIGSSVLCMDTDLDKLKKIESGEVTFYEPGLAPMLLRNSESGRLSFTSSASEAISYGDVLFIAVGTPARPDGSADLDALFQVVTAIGKNMNSPKVVVTKSTVPVGTSKRIRELIKTELKHRNIAVELHVVSNPEFLKEGTAVEDFLKPDRIVVGADTAIGYETMRELYAPFQRRQDILIEMDSASAELTKYTANAMLATRISLMNEISGIAERLGADIEAVRHGVGSDPRIGTSFLYAGCGYGGSCFPKDVSALIHTAESIGVTPHLLKSVEKVNETQKSVLFEKVTSRFGQDLSGMTFAIWGLSFKPDTDDMRCAPSIPLVTRLALSNAKIHAYDPIAVERARDAFQDVQGILYFDSKYAALKDADALILVTEWKEFRAPDFDEMYKSLRAPVIFDGRNQWDPRRMLNMQFEYYSIGRPNHRDQVTS